MKTGQKRILIVDDELPIQRALYRNLSINGYEVFVAENGQQAVEITKLYHPDLILLDLCLPGAMNGLDVCAAIRHELPHTPIIVLSALSEERQKVDALDLGADDYLTKPFGNDELQARVRACLRRAATTSDVRETEVQEPDVVKSDDGHLVMNSVTRQVRVGRKEIRLTPTEFELLRQLMLNAGKVLTHRFLLQAVWGPEYG
ncbi:MAG: response regulator transcription factor, partial [Chloroflexota bacterium]|nr:response regulator transcription factor [Chloroflexota bacterium]